MLIAYLPEYRECGEHLEVVLRLQVSLYGADHEDDHVRVLLDEEGAREVADALHQQVLALSQVHRVDVREGRVVAQHLHVDRAYQQLSQLLLRHISLIEFHFQGLGLCCNDFVLFLLRTRFSYRLH
jgi:hypothetical protein